MRVRDIIGTSIEREYLEQAGVLSNIFVRTVTIENKKIDFLLKRIDSTRLAEKGIDESTESLLRRFIQEERSCIKIRLIDRKDTVVFSTDPLDIVGGMMKDELYGGLFQKASSGDISLAVDTLVQNFIFYRPLGEPPEYLLLFYYTDELLGVIFEEVEGVEFRRFSVPEPGIILINFPTVDRNEQQNLNNLLDIILKEKSGALRVQMKEYDKTLYYVHALKPLSEWVVAYAVDTEKMGISSIGILVLVVQAFVILAIVIFILTSIGERRLGPVAGVEREKTQKIAARNIGQAGKGPEKEPSEIAPVGQAVFPPAPVEEVETEGVPELETGVIPLTGVEEVVELEEVGEAEIAEELEELEEVTEEAGKDAENVKENDEEQPKRPESSEQPKEDIDDDSTGHEQGEKGDPGAVKEAIEIEEAITNDMPAGKNQGDKSLPDLDTLVGTEYTMLKEEIHEGSGRLRDEKNGVLKEAPPTIPDEAYEGQIGVSRDDELAKLIQTIEEGESSRGGKKQIEESISIFREFLNFFSLTRGALLISDRHKNYRPVFMQGFNEKTGKKLMFKSDEKIISEILRKNKILFIREDASMSRFLRTKFDLFDSSTIKRLFLVPVMRSGSRSEKGKELPAALMLVCMTKAEAIADEKISNNILKELKKIKLILSHIV